MKLCTKQLSSTYSVLCPHECRYSVKTYRCCTVNCRKYHKTSVYRSRCILTLVVGDTTVFYLPQGSLKQTIFLTHWQSNKVKLASSAWCPTEPPQEVPTGKMQLQPATAAVPAALFLWEKCKCFPVGAVVSKPDLVAVSCIYKTRLVVSRTTEEKLEERRVRKLEHWSNLSISLFSWYIFIRKILRWSGMYITK